LFLFCYCPGRFGSRLNIAILPEIALAKYFWAHAALPPTAAGSARDSH
jgi:hypothetical protein